MFFVAQPKAPEDLSAVQNLLQPIGFYLENNVLKQELSWSVGDALRALPTAEEYLAEKRDIEFFEKGAAHEQNHDTRALRSDGEEALANVFATVVPGAGDESSSAIGAGEGGSQGARGNHAAGGERASGDDGEAGRLGGRLSGDQPNQRPGAKNGRRDNFAKVYSDSTADDGLVRNPNHFYLNGEIQRESGFDPERRNEENVAAITVLNQLETQKREPTTTEKQTLAKYNGFGGLPLLFKPDSGFLPFWVREGYRVLKEIIYDQSDYKAAQASVNNAHFTSPELVKFIWDTIGEAGFSGGKMLEPALGIGNFLGMMPKELVEKTEIFGIEKDRLTGRMAKHLYPDAKIYVKGFEEVKFPENYFDLVATNVPFGDYSVYDADYHKHRLPIHDYFILKSLKSLKPGGLGVFITSAFTLDKVSAKARRLMHEHGVLAGTIRLPDNAFKDQANVTVATDVLFFVKRDPLRAGRDIQPAWLKVIDATVDFKTHRMNYHYKLNPSSVMGQFVTATGAHGIPRLGVELDKPLAERLKAYAAESTLLPMLRSGRQLHSPQDATWDDEAEAMDKITYVPNRHGLGSLVLQDGQIYEVVDDSYDEDGNPAFALQPYEAKAAAKDKLKGFIEIRDAMDAVFDAQINHSANHELIESTRLVLNERYDGFVKRFGALNASANKKVFAQDPEAGRVFALESYDEEKQEARKADIFAKNIIESRREVVSAKDEIDALALSMTRYGRPDLPYMVRLFNRHHEGQGNTHSILSMRQTLVNSGLCFENPENKRLELAEKYLSGNVKDKLAQAKMIFETTGEYAENIAALEKVLPEDLVASDIDMRLGAAWIPSDIIRDFVIESFELRKESIQHVFIDYRELDGAWMVDFPEYYASQNARFSYGTSERNVAEMLHKILNQQSLEIYKTVKNNDNKDIRVLDNDATIDAQTKADAIRQAFSDYLDAKPDVMARLVRLYNDRFNAFVPAKYDGSHLTFPGMSAAIELRPQQKNAVWRYIQDGNVLLAHEVGTGKTFVMIAAAVESRRLGLCQKPVIVVKNNTIEQFEREARQLYPTAKFLIVSKKDIEAANRKKFIGKAANNHWDAVIITHDMYEKISVGKDFEKRFMEGLLDAYRDELKGYKDKNSQRYSVKQLQTRVKRYEDRLMALVNESEKDDGITMGEIGFDAMFVDEAHNFKNLEISVSSTSVFNGGISGSQCAMDMFMKTRYLYEKRGDISGVCFATGTPVSNSVLEFYNLQRYLQPQRLEQMGLDSIGAWAGTFLMPKTQWEPSPSGQGFKQRTRHTLCNLPEMIGMLGEVMDVVMAEDVVSIKRPEAERINCIAEMTEAQKHIMEELAKRVDAIKNRTSERTNDNILNIVTAGRKMSLYASLYDSSLVENGITKLHLLAKNAKQVYDDTRKDRGAQLVFCDYGTPGSGKEFVVYDVIKSLMVKEGFDPKEIRFIHEAKTDAEVGKMFAEFRAGNIPVLIGSTPRMGEGSNVQTRLAAVHHVDPPWRPSDIEQRDGRMIRHGNIFDFVKRFIYTTKGSFDAFMWTTLQAKAEMFGNAIRGDRSVRRLDMMVDPTYAETAAITSSNPLIQMKIEIDQKVSRLESLHRRWQNEQVEIENMIHADRIRLDELAFDLSAIQALERLNKAWMDGGGLYQWTIDMNRYGFDSEYKGDANKMTQIIKKLIESQEIFVFDGIAFGGVSVVVKQLEDKKNRSLVWSLGDGEQSFVFDSSKALEEFIVNIDHTEQQKRNRIDFIENRIIELIGQKKTDFDRQEELMACREEQRRIQEMVEKGVVIDVLENKQVNGIRAFH